MKKKFTSSLALLLACFMLLSACSTSAPTPSVDPGNSSQPVRSDSPTQESSSLVEVSEYITPGTTTLQVDPAAVSSKDTLTLRVPADFGSLSTVGTDSYALETLSLVSMPLLWPTDPDGLGESLVWAITDKSLLDSYEWSEDYMTFHATIKRGVKFYDGTEVKASDVVFSLKTFYSDASSTASSIDIEHVTATGDYTFDIPLKVLNVSFLSTLGIIYTHSEAGYNACEDAEANFLTSPALLSCGPFKVVKWASGDHLLLERNDNYVNGPAKLKNINIRFISEKSVATMELESGGVDIVEEPLWDDFKIVSEGGYDNIRGWQSTGLYLTEVAFNGASLFADYNLRRAFCLALDKDTIFDGAYDGYGINAYTVMGTGFDGVKSYRENWPFQRDVETAKQLLADAGYPNGFHCRVIYNGDSNQGLALQIMKNMLADVGIDLEILSFDAATYKSMMENETDTWELWCRRWGNTGNPGGMITDTIRPLLHYAEDDPVNQALRDYGNNIRSAPDSDSYTAVFNEFQDRFWDEYLCWFPVQMQSYITLYSNQLKGASRIYVFFDFDNAYFE